MNRTEIIQNEIKINPKDPFNYYLLALEFVKIGRKEEAIFYFNILKNDFEDYLPNYYTYANFLIEIAMDEQAEILIHQGIRLSQQQNNTKAEKELKQLLELNF